MTEIKALETHAYGCAFRSRLEARWATVLNAYGIRWEYEPEAFTLPSGGYLPDFWLPDAMLWAEVKPDRNHENGLARLRELVAHTGFGGVLIGDLAMEPYPFLGFVAQNPDEPCALEHTHKILWEMLGPEASVFGADHMGYRGFVPVDEPLDLGRHRDLVLVRAFAARLRGRSFRAESTRTHMAAPLTADDVLGHAEYWRSMERSRVCKADRGRLC